MRPLLLTSLCLTLIVAAFVPASPVAAQVPAEPCEAFTPCTQVSGPWVTAPSNAGELYMLSCPAGTIAVSADAEFSGPIYPILIEVAGGVGPPGSTVTFGEIALPINVSFQPWVGCAPPGTITLHLRAQPEGTDRTLQTHVRTARIRPGRHVRVRLGCARGERLVHSGSAVGFFTRRPPSPRIVKALEHRHRRTGSVTRTDVTAPAGVGDNERVELQVTTICSR